jgi:hypothetical protein
LACTPSGPPHFLIIPTLAGLQMAPTRRPKRPSAQQLAYPPTPPSADDDDYTPEQAGDSSYYYGPASNTSSKPSSLPHQHHQQRPHSSSMSSATPLQRGSACLSCRKRKMKCDGSRPICQQCNRANRAADCEYDDGKTKTRTQVLQEKIHRLEARIRQLEGPQGGSSSSSKDQGLNPLQQMADIAYEQGSSSLLPEQRTSVSRTLLSLVCSGPTKSHITNIRPLPRRSPLINQTMILTS